MAAEADDLDRAGELTQQLTDAYIANTRAKAAPEQVQRPDGSWPITKCECDEDIPPARLALGKIRCITCQNRVELERRLQ